MRLFTAVDIPEEIRARLTAVVRPLKPLAKLQWSAPEKFHITTKFLGEWPEPRLEELVSVLAGIRSPGPIPISIHSLIWFAGGRVLCAEIDAAASLAELAARTDAALVPLGVPKEDRPYRPHLTLARNRDGADTRSLRAALEKLGSPQFGSFESSKFALYLSQGGKYTQLKEFSFT